MINDACAHAMQMLNACLTPRVLQEVLLKFEQEREGLRVVVLSKSREKIKKN